jgi:hypothetical protein
MYVSKIRLYVGFQLNVGKCDYKMELDYNFGNLDYKLQNPKNTSKLLELNYMLEYKNI